MNTTTAATTGNIAAPAMPRDSIATDPTHVNDKGLRTTNPVTGGNYGGNYGAHYGGDNYGGGNYGHLGPLSPGSGYGPRTDDPVSYQRYFTRIANPGPMGIWAFAITVFLWSFYSVGTRGVNSDIGIVGMGLFVGGLAQFMAGMWEFPRGNVYGSAFFTLYGAFWISYAVNIIVLGPNTPGNGQNGNVGNAIGLYLMVWFIITCFFFLGVIRRSIAFSLLTFFWALSYLLIGIANWPTRHNNALRDAGGAFGFITAIIALYIGLSQLHGSEYSLWSMPLGHIGPFERGAANRAV